MPNPLAKLCNAKSKRTGNPCGAAAMENGKCYHHGGAALRGIAHPNTETGRWSKDLPTRLAARYQESLADPKRLELADELAVIDARLSELLRNLDAGDASGVWEKLQAAKKDLQSADKAKRSDALADILTLIDKGAEEWQRWDDVFDVIAKRTRLAESERRRLVESQQMISSEQTMILLGAIVDIVRRNVKDPSALREVSRGISGLLSKGTSDPT